MKRRLFLIAGLLTLILFAPSFASAQSAPPSEVVTILVNGITPYGTRVIGVIVGERSCGTTVTATATFNGTLNGQPMRFTGNVVERWHSRGFGEDVEVLNTDITGTVNWLPPIRTISLVQTVPNLMFLEGIPVFINGDLAAPCSGKRLYIATNVPRSAEAVTRLPDAGMGWFKHPYVIAAMLILGGLVLIGLGRILREPRSGREATR